VVTNSTLKAMLAHDAFARDSTAAEIRWAIHGVADETEQWITGHRGSSQSRLTYVANGELRVVDADGANDHAVTHGGKALSPSWRHDGRAVVYADMNDSGTQIAWVDLNTGQAKMVDATRRGLNITPVFSPDDRWIYFANGVDNRTELVGVRTDSVLPLKRVTASLPFDCASPAFSPDGARIAFVSSRPNLPQVYSINLDGTGDRLETPHFGSARSYRTSPDWSPDGRSLAFEQQNGDFQVWSVTLQDHKLRKLTSVGENEDPTWAPDARHVALTSNRGGSKAIWILDTQSGRFRQLTNAGDARLAAWSPTLRAAH
ncbi:MAG: DPP IV N-terminal domain-containing protein, partial [Gemmatimonadaceae bacterium]